MDDSGLKSEISVRELISNGKKKAQAGNEWSNILPKILASEEKASNIILRLFLTTARWMSSAVARQHYKVRRSVQTWETNFNIKLDVKFM